MTSPSIKYVSQLLYMTSNWVDQSFIKHVLHLLYMTSNWDDMSIYQKCPSTFTHDLKLGRPVFHQKCLSLFIHDLKLGWPVHLSNMSFNFYASPQTGMTNPTTKHVPQLLYITSNWDDLSIYQTCRSTFMHHLKMGWRIQLPNMSLNFYTSPQTVMICPFIKHVVRLLCITSNWDVWIIIKKHPLIHQLKLMKTHLVKQHKLEVSISKHQYWSTHKECVSGLKSTTQPSS